MREFLLMVLAIVTVFGIGWYIRRARSAETKMQIIRDIETISAESIEAFNERMGGVLKKFRSDESTA